MAINNPFAQLTNSEDLSGFSKTVKGSGFLTEGIHEVTITDVEVRESKKGNAYLLVKLANDEGSGINTVVPLIMNTKEGTIERHFRYQELASALSKDVDLVTEVFGNHIAENFGDIVKIIGLRLRIKVGLENEGCTISRAEDGSILILDVSTGLPAVEDTFENFQDASTFLKESDLKRAFMEVKRMSNSVEDTDNDDRLRSIIEAGSGTTKGKASVKPIGAKAARTAF